MIKISKGFSNEEGNQIELEVCYDNRGVTISATGPTGKVEHTWTPGEAEVLYELMSLVRPGYKN